VVHLFPFWYVAPKIWQPRIFDPSLISNFAQLKNGGQGIFALRNLPANSIVAFYNGVRFNDCHVRKVSVTDNNRGCQIVYFHTKNTNLDKFWRVLQWKM
jgi:hypothetical protein